MSEAGKAFTRSIKDAEELLERFDAEKEKGSRWSTETLKRTGMVMALAAWETYIKDRVREEFEVWLKPVDGSPVGRFFRKKLDEDLKRFFNPNSDKTKRLFLSYFEVDVTSSWSWDNYSPPQARKVLDAFISKRGDAAHKANTSVNPSANPHLIKRDDLEKAIRFLKGLVSATEKACIAK